MSEKISIFVTAPGLVSTASPYREMIALARYLPRDRFSLTFCALRNFTSEDFLAELDTLGHAHMIARFRQRGFRPRQWLSLLKDQKKIAEAGPFDIQHSMDFSTVPVEPFLARRAGRIFIHFQKYTMRTVQAPAVLRLRLQAAHAVHVLSDNTYQDVRRLGVRDNKIHKIFNGIDLAEIPMNHTGQGDYILVVGQIIPIKGHHDSIRAFARIAPEFPELQLKIAGIIHDQVYYERLVVLARELGIADRVEFMGKRDDILELMRHARLFMLCSEADALPWVIIEAQAVGTPVVVTNVEGAGEIVQDGKTGYTLSPGDIDGYAARMRYVLNNPEHGRDLAAEGRKRIEAHYSASVMVEHIATMYETLYGTLK